MHLSELQVKIIDFITSHLSESSDDMDNDLDGFLIHSNRLRMHRNGYVERIRSGLLDVFARTETQLGAQQFQCIAQEYACSVQFGSYDLHQVCERFPEYLRECGTPDAIIELAEFEWRCSLSFHAISCETLSWQNILEGLKEHSANLTLKLQPFVQTFKASTPIFHFFGQPLATRFENDMAIQTKMDGFEHLLILRFNGAAKCEVISEPQEICLNMLIKGCDLNDVCATLEAYAQENNSDASDMMLHQWLFDWADRGLFASEEKKRF